MNPKKVLSLKKGGKIQLIVGISSYHITDSEALTTLLEMDDTFKSFEVGYFYHEGFHPKIFCLKMVKKRAVIVGSSNLAFPGHSKRHIFGIAKVKSLYYFDEEDGLKGHFAHKGA